MSNVRRDAEHSKLRTSLRGTSIKVSGVVSTAKWERQEQRAAHNTANNEHVNQDLAEGALAFLSGRA